MTIVDPNMIPTDRYNRVLSREKHGTYYISEPLREHSENKSFETLRDALAKAGVTLTRESYNAEVTRVLSAKTVEVYLRAPRNGSGYLLDSRGKKRLFQFLRPAFQFDEAD